MIFMHTNESLPRVISHEWDFTAHVRLSSTLIWTHDSPAAFRILMGMWMPVNIKKINLCVRAGVSVVLWDQSTVKTVRRASAVQRFRFRTRLVAMKRRDVSMSGKMRNGFIRWRQTQIRMIWSRFESHATKTSIAHQHKNGANHRGIELLSRWELGESFVWDIE